MCQELIAGNDLDVIEVSPKIAGVDNTRVVWLKDK